MKISEMNLCIKATLAYAYSPRENTGSGGKHHIQAQELVQTGRFTRQQGDTLCRKAQRFWGLQTCLDQNQNVTCPRCLEIAEKLRTAQ